MSAHGRHYPNVPRVGVGVTVLRPRDQAGEWDVLLVRRAKAPAKGMWSLPGGAVELGETIAQAAEREVWEETGLTIAPGPAFTAVDAIHRDAQGRVVFHYVIVEVVATVPADARAEPRSDVDAVRWVPTENVGTVRPLTPRVPEVVELALQIVRRGPTADI